MVRVLQQNKFFEGLFWKIFSEKFTVWNNQLVFSSYNNLCHSVKEFLARISNLNTYQSIHMCKA